MDRRDIISKQLHSSADKVKRGPRAAAVKICLVQTKQRCFIFFFLPLIELMPLSVSFGVAFQSERVLLRTGATLPTGQNGLTFPQLEGFCRWFE